MVTDTGKKTVITTWMHSFVDKYTKKDKRNMLGALNRFKNFFALQKQSGLLFGRINELIISEFQDYLRQHSTGEGTSSYFNRFKKLVKQAYRQKLIANKPATEVRTIQGSAKKKDTLTLEKLQLLASTPTESQEIKRAFLYSCLAGVRWADVKSLHWKDVNIHNKYMDVQQSKTDGPGSQSESERFSTEAAGREGKPEDSVFTLPTANGANKTLKAWVSRAGIKKKITWHNARHTQFRDQSDLLRC